MTEEGYVRKFKVVNEYLNYAVIFFFVSFQHFFETPLLPLINLTFHCEL